MDTNEQKNHNNGTPCVMCNLHHMVHGKSLCNMCGGANHFSLARIALGLFIVAVTLWIGIEIGGAMGVDRDYGYDRGGYPQKMHMMQGGMYDTGYYNERVYAPMQRVRTQGTEIQVTE